MSLSARTSSPLSGRGQAIVPLESGDRLTQAEFERRYSAMPQLKKAELIEGIVYTAAAVRLHHHGRPHGHLVTWLGAYEARTPGVLVADNASLRLDLDNEPQPDAALCIDPQRGGQIRISEDDYLEGAPELIAEIASTTVSYDLGDKLQAYRRNGVCEYLVWRVRDGELDWFALRAGVYERLSAGSDGIHRSGVFPGLWLDATALLSGDLARVLDVLATGVRSPEHENFLTRLARGTSG